MKKRICAFLCAIITLFACSLNVSALEFVKIGNVSERAEDEVHRAILSDIVDLQWIQDCTAPVTREMFCEFLVQLGLQMNGFDDSFNDKVYSLSNKIEDKKFIDLNEGFYDEYIDLALGLELIRGVDETHFEPQRPVTRQEAAVMLHRLFKRFGYETEKVDITKYSDHDSVAEWARDSVENLWSCEPFVSVLNNDEIIPEGTISCEEIIVMRWRFYEEKFGRQDILFFEDSTYEILTEIGLVTEEDFKKEGNISVREVFEIVSKIAPKVKNVDYRLWYRENDLAALDGIDENDKKLLITLSTELDNVIFYNYKELSRINPNLGVDITYGDAYKYMLRCVEPRDSQRYADFYERMETEIEKVYSTAFDIGLIDSPDTSNADKPIPRQEFYELLHRTVFCEHYDVMTELYGCYKIDRYADMDFTESENLCEIELKNVRWNTINYASSVAPNVRVEWDLPTELWENEPEPEIIHDVYDSNFRTELIFADMGGNELFREYSEQIVASISHVERYMLNKYPSVPVAVRGKYINKNNGDEYLFEIDLSHIEVVESGKALKPNELLKTPQSSGVYEISLKEGEVFEKDNFYGIVIRDDRYRKDELNSDIYSIFRASETANSLKLDSAWMLPEWYKTGDAYIRKVIFDGDFATETKIIITPAPEENFKVDYYRPWLEK